MLKYTNTDKTSATFNGASFSLDAPENWASIGDTPTREAVLAWLAEVNEPEPADPIPEPVIPPMVVSRNQGMTALYLMGTPEDNPLLSVNTYMETADFLEQLAWKNISEFREDSELLLKLAGLLGITPVMVKDLFVFAATIQA